MFRSWNSCCLYTWAWEAYRVSLVKAVALSSPAHLTCHSLCRSLGVLPVLFPQSPRFCCSQWTSTKGKVFCSRDWPHFLQLAFPSKGEVGTRRVQLSMLKPIRDRSVLSGSNTWRSRFRGGGLHRCLATSGSPSHELLRCLQHAFDLWPSYATRRPRPKERSVSPFLAGRSAYSLAMCAEVFVSFLNYFGCYDTRGEHS